MCFIVKISYMFDYSLRKAMLFLEILLLSQSSWFFISELSKFGSGIIYWSTGVVRFRANWTFWFLALYWSIVWSSSSNSRFKYWMREPGSCLDCYCNDYFCLSKDFFRWSKAEACPDGIAKGLKNLIPGAWLPFGLVGALMLRFCFCNL